MTSQLVISDKSTTPAPFRQIVKHFREKIDSGELKNGDVLTSEITLSKELQISRATVSKAYSELMQLGYIKRTKGLGTFVDREIKNIEKTSLAILCGGDPEEAESPIKQEYVFGFQRGCEKQGFETRLCFYTPDDRKYSHTSSTRGIAVLHNDLDLLPKEEVPTVLLMGHIDKNINADWVHCDNHEGGALAARHLTELGHKRLACYSQFIWHRGVQERIDGFNEEAALHGINIPDNLLANTKNNPTVDNFRELLQKPNRPTAIFCTSDRGGIDIMNMAKKIGLEIPKDLSIITFDGTIFSDLCDPKLTCIFSDRKKMGEKAAELLAKRIKDPSSNTSPREVITPVVLRVGESTGKAPI
ncbi:MAG: LacI family DNA-binding transcriptional regulator [Planctomycetota bacterium]|jgi:DNA-binding LacI/PurR family transcriptional regulator